jgi:hypothetical protein
MVGVEVLVPPREVIPTSLVDKAAKAVIKMTITRIKVTMVPKLRLLDIFLLLDRRFSYQGRPVHASGVCSHFA